MLPVQVEQALHSVRVIGNNAVHLGASDLNDNPDLASRLFDLVNHIVSEAIVRPKRIAEIYSNLPENARDGIDAKKRLRSRHSQE